MSPTPFSIGDISISLEGPLFLFAGPCVIEDLDLCLEIAQYLLTLRETTQVPVVFKASFDKANRSRLQFSWTRPEGGPQDPRRRPRPNRVADHDGPA